MKKLEILKTEYDLLYDYIAQGVLVRSRAKWYEQGEKSNKNVLNLESSRGKKSSIRDIFLDDQALTTNSESIYYLYQENSDLCSETRTDSFLRGISMLKLSDAQNLKCEENLPVREYYKFPKIFLKERNIRQRWTGYGIVLFSIFANPWEAFSCFF